jgi:hypothetical protein
VPLDRIKDELALKLLLKQRVQNDKQNGLVRKRLINKLNFESRKRGSKLTKASSTN